MTTFHRGKNSIGFQVVPTHKGQAPYRSSSQSVTVLKARLHAHSFITSRGKLTPQVCFIEYLHRTNLHTGFFFFLGLMSFVSPWKNFTCSMANKTFNSHREREGKQFSSLNLLEIHPAKPQPQLTSPNPNSQLILILLFFCACVDFFLFLNKGQNVLTGAYWEL